MDFISKLSRMLFGTNQPAFSGTSINAPAQKQQSAPPQPAQAAKQSPSCTAAIRNSKTDRYVLRCPHSSITSYQ